MLSVINMEKKPTYHSFNSLAHFCEIFRSLSSKFRIQLVTCEWQCAVVMVGPPLIYKERGKTHHNLYQMYKTSLLPYLVIT